jgi:hypothetical protein
MRATGERVGRVVRSLQGVTAETLYDVCYVVLPQRGKIIGGPFDVPANANLEAIRETAQKNGVPPGSRLSAYVTAKADPRPSVNRPAVHVELTLPGGATTLRRRLGRKFPGRKLTDLQMTVFTYTTA